MPASVPSAPTRKPCSEATELILRGAIKALALSALEAVRVEGDALCFSVGPESVSLQLGAPEAGKWADPSPRRLKSLAAKLGLAPERPAWVLGMVADAALADALAGHTAPTLATANAVAGGAARAHGVARVAEPTAGAAVPALWAVTLAAPWTPPCTALRAAGWRDAKVCAVSERLTATRYLPPTVR